MRSVVQFILQLLVVCYIILLLLSLILSPTATTVTVIWQSPANVVTSDNTCSSTQVYRKLFLQRISWSQNFTINPNKYLLNVISNSINVTKLTSKYLWSQADKVYILYSLLPPHLVPISITAEKLYVKLSIYWTSALSSTVVSSETPKKVRCIPVKFRCTRRLV